MNLYFLVEGRRTEKDVYRRWVEYAFPGISHVQTVAEMTGDTCYILSGYGVPSYKRRIRDAMRDIKGNAAVDHLFVCIDAEELTYEARYLEVAGEIERSEQETRVREGNPTFQTHVMVQDCCIETWFLGHRKMMRKAPSSAVLAQDRRFHDVREEDPERMGAYPGFRTRASFHEVYLQEMLLDQNPKLRYSKVNPAGVLTRDYFDALRERTVSTRHLGSLRKLLETWEQIGAQRNSGAT